MFLYNAATLKQYGTSTGIELYANKVRIVANATRKLLTVGTEAGTVSVYDITNPANVVPSMTPVATINLRAVTGHTGPEDIEIRSLTTRLDAYGHLWIYAASSWGNSSMTSAYRSQLPSFFVLELK